MLSSIEAGLNRPWHRLRLPEALETRFQASNGPADAARMRSWLAIFIVFNCLSLKTDLDLFGAQAILVPALLTLGLFVPVALGAILVLRGDPSPLRRTAAAFATSVVDMGIVLNSARTVPAQHADVYLVLAAIVPLVVGMIAPMSFRHSLFYCGGCFLLYVGAVTVCELGPHGNGVPFLVASLILVPLKLSFSREWEMRQSFLLGLRDRVQADALAAANARLTVLSETDPLTGVANRRLLDRRLDAAWEAAGNGFQRLGLALVDVDHFKAFNDAAGHAEGDRCLRAVAQALSGALSAAVTEQGGFVARYGGEEFVAVIPGADAQAMRAAGRRLHAAVAALAWPHPGLAPAPADRNGEDGGEPAWRPGEAGIRDAKRAAGSRDVRREGTVSVSVGVSAVHGAARALGLSPADLLASADRALYRAKRAGRDRVESENLPLPGSPADAVQVRLVDQSVSRSARPYRSK